MTKTPSEFSPTHRYAVGDQVRWTDPVAENWPPVESVGEIVAFDNETLTHLSVTFEDGVTRVLTEDDLGRVT